MRILMLMLTGLLLLTMLPVLAKDPPKPPTAQDIMKKGEYAVMVAECGLTEAQKTKIGQTVIDANAAVADWNARNKVELDKYAADIKAARAANDHDTVKRLSAEQKALLAQRTAITAQMNADIQAILTPEQQQQWGAYRLRVDVQKRYKKLNLTPAQVELLKPLCTAAQQELAALTPEQAKARAKVIANLNSAVEKGVLTDEQRAALAAEAERLKAEKEQRAREAKEKAAR